MALIRENPIWRASTTISGNFTSDTVDIQKQLSWGIHIIGEDINHTLSGVLQVHVGNKRGKLQAITINDTSTDITVTPGGGSNELNELVDIFTAFHYCEVLFIGSGSCNNFSIIGHSKD